MRKLRPLSNAKYARSSLTCYQFWLQIRLVHQTSLSKTTNKFARILPGLSHVENWHSPVALNPLNFSSCHWLSLHESSFTATLLGWQGGGGTGGMLPPVAPSHYWVSLTCRSLVGNPPSLPHPAKHGSQWTLLKKCTTSYLWWNYTYSAGKYRKLVFDHIWISCMDGG